MLDRGSVVSPEAILRTVWKGMPASADSVLSSAQDSGASRLRISSVVMPRHYRIRFQCAREIFASLPKKVLTSVTVLGSICPSRHLTHYVGEQGMAVQIEKGIVFPPPAHPGRPSVYPWKTMDVGDSFVMEVPDGYKRALQASHAHKPLQFKARKLGDGQFRIWRVA